jgi:hypothetical protein
MTDEERIGQAGAEREMRPSPAGQNEQEVEQSVGRREDVGHSGVYPASGDVPEGDMPIRTPAEWGHGEAGRQGYEESGSSELTPPDKTGDEPR